MRFRQTKILVPETKQKKNKIIKNNDKKKLTNELIVLQKKNIKLVSVLNSNPVMLWQKTTKWETYSNYIHWSINQITYQNM